MYTRTEYEYSRVVERLEALETELAELHELYDDRCRDLTHEYNRANAAETAVERMSASLAAARDTLEVAAMYVGKALADGAYYNTAIASRALDKINAALYGDTGCSERPPTIYDILSLAASLPAGLNDPRAADKLLAERQELVEALEAGDREGALTEAADAVYYAVKYLEWTARQLDLPVEVLLRLAVAKYELRARPGNPKDDAAERAACAMVVGESLS